MLRARLLRMLGRLVAGLDARRQVWRGSVGGIVPLLSKVLENWCYDCCIGLIWRAEAQLSLVVARLLQGLDPAAPTARVHRVQNFGSIGARCCRWQEVATAGRSGRVVSGHMLSWGSSRVLAPKGTDAGPQMNSVLATASIMLPPVEDAVLKNNPEFAALYSTLTATILNPDGSTRKDAAAKERSAVREVCGRLANQSRSKWSH